MQWPGKGITPRIRMYLLTSLHMVDINRICTRLRNHYSPRLRRLADVGTPSSACFIVSRRLSLADDSMRDRSRLPDKIYNVHYENDIRYTMQLCRWILKPIGIWHLVYGHSSQYEKLLSITLIFACFSVLCFVLVPSGPYTLLREKDINVKLKLFGPVGFCLTSAMKYCFLGMRGTAIGKCIKHVEHDWQMVQYQDHRKMMLRNVLVGRRLTTLCVIFSLHRWNVLSYNYAAVIYENEQ